ncbi:Heterokaryon incompatibility [Metarhizium guizhouense ARSEF 977]|uniref:Heterokaryon incompatibility n=1 Tax=Metarhizium guizhouense (strain ARSEF 977) TaxID=1276136 RepID=A0A0B4HA68_METGA|nr:Heterokaryon incompatibility [Metarhizium guizhouense ARSEF 977]
MHLPCGQGQQGPHLDLFPGYLDKLSLCTSQNGVEFVVHSAAVMPLCDICKSIPFKHLPPFPKEEYVRTSTGLEHVQTLVPNKFNPRGATAPRVRYHANTQSLRGEAAEGCELCLLIQGEADVMLAELEDHEGRMKDDSDGPPTFYMCLTKRPDGGQGFWVLSECSPRARGTVTVPVAVFGFTVADMSESWPLLALLPGR